MATTKPRVNVTLDPHRYELLKRLATLQGVSMSYLISDLLETVADPLERVCVVLEAASKAPQNVKEGLRSALDKAEREFLPRAAEVMDQADLFFAEMTGRLAEGGAGDGAERNAPAPGTGAAQDPRPVTRGSTPLRKAKEAHPGKTSKPLSSKARKAVSHEI